MARIRGLGLDGTAQQAALPLETKMYQTAFLADDPMLPGRPPVFTPRRPGDNKGMKNLFLGFTSRAHDPTFIQMRSEH